MKVSDCCGARPRGFLGPHGTVDSDSTDYGICPDCKDHCEFIEEEDEEKPTPEQTTAVINSFMNAAKKEFEEKQKLPFQYVVAYYDKSNNLLGYHADTFCNLTQEKMAGKRYSGENPYTQLEIIRKNLDYTLDMTEEKAPKVFLGALNLRVKERHFKDLSKEDVFIDAVYLDEGIPPQRFVWKQIN